MKTILISAIVAMSATSAFAMDIANRPQSVNVEDRRIASVMETPATETIDNTAAIMAIIQPVCDKSATIVLSKDAIKACAGDPKKLPKLTKKGDRLTKGRTGAEFNTLLANIAAF